MLNPFPIILNFSDSPCVYGINMITAGLSSLHFCFLYWDFLLITDSVNHIFWVRIRSKKKKKMLSHSWMSIMKEGTLLRRQ